MDVIVVVEGVEVRCGICVDDGWCFGVYGGVIEGEIIGDGGFGGFGVRVGCV